MMQCVNMSINLNHGYVFSFVGCLDPVNLLDQYVPSNSFDHCYCTFSLSHRNSPAIEWIFGAQVAKWGLQFVKQQESEAPLRVMLLNGFQRMSAMWLGFG